MGVTKKLHRQEHAQTRATHKRVLFIWYCLHFREVRWVGVAENNIAIKGEKQNQIYKQKVHQLIRIWINKIVLGAFIYLIPVNFGIIWNYNFQNLTWIPRYKLDKISCTDRCIRFTHKSTVFKRVISHDNHQNIILELLW